MSPASPRLPALPRDGVRDATPALAARLARGGLVTLPPGDYFLPGDQPIALQSGTRVLAHGARFHLPATLGDRRHLTLFAGSDLADFHWQGGHFQGNCFNPARPENPWEPNACTRAIVVTAQTPGKCHDLSFRELSGQDMAGAVVTVLGQRSPSDEKAVAVFAERVSIQDCRLMDCGKFMWDYGLLWQILIWPEDYDERARTMAERYFNQQLRVRGVRLRDGDDRVPLRLAAPVRDLCFFADRLPANLVRGRRYAVVEQTADSLRIAETDGGPPLRFAGDSGPELQVIHSLHAAFYQLFWPMGCGPGKGAVDLCACRYTQMSGNRLSALGDTMHLQRCHHNLFTNNQITGSRMGAFFIAEYCHDTVVTGNMVDGSNGSRVMSVEKSSSDVTIIGNTFRQGGRGSWINQPRNLILQGNVFVNNTTKGERDPRRGRRSYETGDYERWPEMYFTTHEPGGRYGPVTISDNLFETGPEARQTLHFAAGGHDLLVRGNQFHGPVRSVSADPACERVVMADNHGL